PRSRRGAMRSRYIVIASLTRPAGWRTRASPVRTSPRVHGVRWWTPLHREIHRPLGRSRLGLRRPPGVEARVGVRLGKRALVEADLEEVGQRVADVAARADAEVVHHLLAVEVGPDGVELLLLLELLDADLELVHAPGQVRGLALVARRAVR